MQNIVLIGIMGCGKTTIGKRLSQTLNREFVDCDDYVVTKFNMTIPEMFDISEDYFRTNETKAIKDLSKLENKVISTGGGVIVRDENIDLLKQNGIIFYIDRPIDNITKDVNIKTRPLLKDGPSRLYELDKQRRNLYLNACDYHIINDTTIDDVIEKIIEVIK